MQLHKEALDVRSDFFAAVISTKRKSNSDHLSGFSELVIQR